jgi:hypothetical protein
MSSKKKEIAKISFCKKLIVGKITNFGQKFKRRLSPPEISWNPSYSRGIPFEKRNSHYYAGCQDIFC